MTSLDRLAATVTDRKGADPATSWTAKLLAAGIACAGDAAKPEEE